MPYHHGNLREALVESGVELARKGGPEEVGLRAVTRAAGVSHNAAYRHFADLDDLLDAVGTSCMRRLGELVEARLDTATRAAARAGRSADPAGVSRERIKVCGRAYVDFALTEPGWFRTAFGCCQGAPDMDVASPRHPYRILNDLLDEMVDTGALAPERRPGAEYAAWSAVHGISTLLLDGPLRDLPHESRQAAIDKVIDSSIAGL